jgi:quinate dehydrogenase
MSLEARTPDVSQVERHGYLFGHPIAHSMSPLLHQTVYDNMGLDWSQIPLDSKDMNLFLELIKHPQFYGKSVLIPKDSASLQYYRRIGHHASQSCHSQTFGWPHG